MRTLPLAIIKSFETLGLNINEIKVISALYKLGDVKVYELTRHLKKIDRTNLYKILENLVKIHLVKKIINNNVTYFQLKTNPEIFRWANKQKILAERKTDECTISVKNIKDYLSTIKRETTQMPTFHLFQGEKGFKLAHKFIFNKSQVLIRGYLNISRIKKQYPAFLDLLNISTETLKNEAKCLFIEMGNELPYELNKKIEIHIAAKEVGNLFIGEDQLLIYIGDNWILSFNEDLKGDYIDFKEFGYIDMFKNIFNNDWLLVK